MDLSDPPAAGLDDGSTTVADEERPPPVELEPSPASPGDPPASPADDQSSGSSSAWTSTVEGSDELSPVAATRNSEQSPDLSDSDAADDELELTNDGSASPGSAERDNEMERLAHLFDQTLFAGGAERDLNRYLAMLAYELERDTHNDKVKPAYVPLSSGRAPLLAQAPFFRSGLQLTARPLAPICLQCRLSPECCQCPGDI
jgi:hypothetical protein